MDSCYYTKPSVIQTAVICSLHRLLCMAGIRACRKKLFERLIFTTLLDTPTHVTKLRIATYVGVSNIQSYKERNVQWIYIIRKMHFLKSTARVSSVLIPLENFLFELALHWSASFLLATRVRNSGVARILGRAGHKSVEQGQSRCWITWNFT